MARAAESELTTRGNINRGVLKKYWIPISLTIIILASFLLMIFSSIGDSLVVDEKVHIPAGYLHVWQGNYTFNSEHPPLLNDLAGLFAKLGNPKLPEVDLREYQAGDQWEYGDLFFYNAGSSAQAGPEGPPFGGNNVDKIVFWARFPFILLTLGLIYLCFIWAKTVFGPKAGLLAAALVGFCPNILAHGHLATTDIGVAFFFLLSIWLLRKYILRPTYANAFLLGLAVALAILAKFSGLLVLPIVFGGLLYLWLFRKSKLPDVLGQFLLILVTVFVTCFLLYIFSMRGDLTASGWFNGPVDKFLQGYKILAEHNTTGHWNYLNGQVNSTGWWYYFPLVLWYKLTLPTLILLGLAIIFGRYKKSFIEEYLIIFPIIFFLGVSMTSKIDIGIRHILPLLPFLFIFISRLAMRENLILKPVVTGLVILHVVFGILAYPNYIAYFNQIAGGEKGGINHLVDSNLDWNQNMKRFAKYAQENNLGKVYEYCWDSSAFSYYGIQNEFLPASPAGGPTTPIQEGTAIVCAHQLKLYQAYGYDISWITNPPTGGPPTDIVGATMYVWRF